MHDAAAPPAGWYADPQEPRRWRWWDGAAWTDNVSGGSGAGVLWSAKTLWVVSRARVGSWSADVRDEAGALAGTVRGGMEMTLADAGSSPQLVLRAERDHWAAGRRTGLGRVAVSDPRGSPLGTLEVTKHFNARVTLSVRSSDRELAVLEPEAKSDKAFAVRDSAGAGIARIVAAKSARKLLSQDRTWWVSLERPLPQPLDSLVLGAAVALNNIQLMVVNLADRRE